MTKFLAVYLGTAESMEKWKALLEATQKEREKAGMAAWQKWVTDNASVIVEGGSPLGKTKRVDPKGISDVRNEMAAFTIVEAKSQEDAAKLFVNHPHFSIFPGTAVEIMECLPMPKM